MSNTFLFVLSVLVCLGICWGCDKSDEPASTASLEPSASVNPLEQVEPMQVESKGDKPLKTVTIGGDDDSEQISYGGDDVELPKGWPEFLEIYEGAKLISAQRQDKFVDGYLCIGLATQDKAEITLEFYKTLLMKLGYEMMKMGDIEGFKKYQFLDDERTVEVLCQDEESRTMVYVSTWKTSEV